MSIVEIANIKSEGKNGCRLAFPPKAEMPEERKYAAGECV